MRIDIHGPQRWRDFSWLETERETFIEKEELERSVSFNKNMHKHGV